MVPITYLLLIATTTHGCHADVGTETVLIFDNSDTRLLIPIIDCILSMLGYDARRHWLSTPRWLLRNWQQMC